MFKKRYEKNEILEKICVASRIENLGLFIGSGFSKAVMEDSGKTALSWLELLKNICNEYSIKENFFKEGFTYPLIASKIIDIIALSEENMSLEEATKNVKNSIAKMVNVSPNDLTRNKFNVYFSELKPKWIVTTNYDNVIERIVGPSAYPILPNYLFYNTKNILPIYHIHGSVLEPQSIVITNEDYAKTMRPSDYRHTRLPILMKESTILMMGYALGDLNVLSAIDYRNNIFSNKSQIDNSIIQMVYTENPKNHCYEDKSIIIYEFDNLSTFFDELIDYLKRYRSKIGNITNLVTKKQEDFISDDTQYVRSFEYNRNNYRTDTIKFVNELDNSYCYLYAQFIPFLERVFNNVLTKGQRAYQFHFYDYYLNIFLDLVKNIDVETVPTIYAAFLVEKLDVIAVYIGDTPGQGYDAYETWKKRKNDIPSTFINFVKTSLNELNNRYYLQKLLDIG